MYRTAILGNYRSYNNAFGVPWSWAHCNSDAALQALDSICLNKILNKTILLDQHNLDPSRMRFHQRKIQPWERSCSEVTHLKSRARTRCVPAPTHLGLQAALHMLSVPLREFLWIYVNFQGFSPAVGRCFPELRALLSWWEGALCSSSGKTWWKPARNYKEGLKHDKILRAC